MAQLSTQTLLLSLLAGTALCGCGGGGGVATANVPPSLSVSSPAADVVVGLGWGGTVEVTYTADDPDDVATTDVYADRDGNLVTTGDQVVVAEGLAELDGGVQSVSWDVAGAPPGRYVVLARTNDGEEAVTSEAPGRVLLNAAPALSIAAPSRDVRAHPGEVAALAISYTDDDADDVALTTILADEDGDLQTTEDSHVIAAGRPDANGAPQDVSWTLGSVPIGDYRILGEVEDGTNPAAVAMASGRVSVRNFAWARRTGGAQTDLGNGVAAFPDGSFVVVGDFEGTATFGVGPGAPSLTSAGSLDLFVAKYDGSGALVWAKRAGGTATDHAYAVATFADGSCVVTGNFMGTATFGEAPSAFVLTSGGSADAFVVRYDAAGTPAWAKQAGGGNNDSGNGVAAFAYGSCAVVGSFSGVGATFGEGTGTTTLTNRGVHDVFVARYDSDGALAWAKQGGGSADDWGYGIAAFGDGSCVATGTFGAEADFGEGVNEVTLDPYAPTGQFDVFVARYDTLGNLAWAKVSTGAGVTDRGDGVATFPDGSCVVTGRFESTLTFGEGAGAIPLTSAGDGDIFVARYGATGTLTWARRAGGPGVDWGRAIAARASGACVVTGHVSNTATFGSGTGAPALTSHGGTDVFVARYDASGTPTGVKQAGGTGTDDGRGVAVLPDGASVVTGAFESTAQFGTAAEGVSTAAAGASDAFVAH